MPTLLALGNVRRVELRDLPDNQKIFDVLDKTDFAVRYDISDPIDGHGNTRYMDILVWYKSSVYLGEDTIRAIIENWWYQIDEICKRGDWICDQSRPSINEFFTSLNKRLPKSITSPPKEKIAISKAWRNFHTDLVKSDKPPARILKCNGVDKLVERNPEGPTVRLYGQGGVYFHPRDSVRPTPRPNLAQGKLEMVIVDEPLRKVGPSGYKCLVSGTFAGTKVILVLSNELSGKITETLTTELLNAINEPWKDIYERATLTQELFDELVEKTGFKLDVPFRPMSMAVLQQMLAHVDHLLPDVTFPVTLTCDPRVLHAE